MLRAAPCYTGYCPFFVYRVFPRQISSESLNEIKKKCENHTDQDTRRNREIKIEILPFNMDVSREFTNERYSLSVDHESSQYDQENPYQDDDFSKKGKSIHAIVSWFQSHKFPRPC